MTDRHRYLPTWKGAFIMTWRQCWPVKQLRMKLIMADARRQLQGLGLNLLPMLAAVEEKATSTVRAVMNPEDHVEVVMGFPVKPESSRGIGGVDDRTGGG